MNQEQPISNRLIYRVANHLPKWLRVIYYIVVTLTLIYLLYRLIEWVLKTIQKLGAFVFEPRNYWTAVMTIGLLLVGTFIVAQFVLGLDPLGNFMEWVKNSFENAIRGLVDEWT